MFNWTYNAKALNTKPLTIGDLTMTDTKKQIINLSSGTLSTLTGLDKYESLTSVHADFCQFAWDKNWNFSNWKDAWFQFITKSPRGKRFEENIEAIRIT